MGEMMNTNNVSERLVRLPLWLGLDEQQTGVIEKVIEMINEIGR